MQYDNETTRSVADAVTRILSGQPVSEALKGDQHKIDANKNNKIDAHDFELLRKKKKVEEDVEPVDEANKETKKEFQSRQERLSAAHDQTQKDPERMKKLMKVPGYSAAMTLAQKTTQKEEVEQIDEYDSKQGVYKHKGTYGSAKGAEYGATDYKKENELAKAADKEKKKPARKAYGARQNFVRSYAKESFSGMMDVYKEGGLKSLHESLVKEEPTNDEFTAEVQNAKDKAALKKKQPDLAKPSVQAVKVEENLQDIHVINVDIANGVEIEDIQERSLTEPEMKKKEDIVKGMKKNLAGFKDRYGDRAKEVMYATATKSAKKD